MSALGLFLIKETCYHLEERNKISSEKPQRHCRFLTSFMFNFPRFARKVPMCKTRQETSWLYHEIGNCFLVLQQYDYAAEAARRSLEAAEEALDWNYQLQSGVLLGVSLGKSQTFVISNVSSIECPWDGS